MPVSLEELLDATKYRSLSRTGRTTDSVSSKARHHFQQSIIKRKTLADDAAMGKKRQINPLKLLTVSEVVDTEQEAQRLQKCIPAELQDERVDLLVSSAREHPEVERKGQYIVTLEKEIAFHQAMTDFHGGVDTAASLQAAEVAARKRTDAERVEQERREHAFSTAGTLAATPTKSSPSGSPQQSPHNKRHKEKGLNSLQMESVSPTAASRAFTPSPSFASKSSRFAKTEQSLAPPVGHYRPRHGVVDVTSPAPAFPKHKRILNPIIESSYIGDKMTPDEREKAILNLSRPGTVAASVPVSPKASFGHSQLNLSTPPVSPKFGATDGNSPASLISSTPPLSGSPCFKAPGRDTLPMTRGGAATPEVSDKKRGGHKNARGASPERPSTVADHLVRARERSAVHMDHQLGREPISALGMSALNDTTKMPLRNGNPLFGNGVKGHALSFDSHASREQRARCTEMKPEQLAQRFYDRSFLEKIKYSRFAVHEFSKSPVRGRSPPAGDHHHASGESHLMKGSPVPEPPRSHTPGFKMELSPARLGVELPMHDVQYDVRDEILRPNTRQAVIAPPSSNHSPLRQQSMTAPSSPSQLASGVPDSPSIRRKYIRDIDFSKHVSREAIDGRTHPSNAPDPVPAERLEKALAYTRPAAKALVPIASVVSRDRRDQIGSPERITLNIDTRCAGADTSQLANLKLGYVQFGKMADRDHQGGNAFANDSRSLTKLFNESSTSPKRSYDSATREKRRGGSPSPTPVAS